MTLTLRLVRHGVTAWNVEGRLQGHTDVPLSDDGRAQARRLGARFAAAVKPDAPHSLLATTPDFIFTSDLSRAIETASIAARQYYLSPAATIATERLRERGFGPFEGLTAEEARQRFGPSHTHRNAGEPKAAVWERVGSVLNDMWELGTKGGAKDGCILVVGHGGSLREFVCRAIGHEDSSARSFHLDNTGLSIVQICGSSLEQSEGRIFLWNDTAHLFYEDPDA